MATEEVGHGAKDLMTADEAVRRLREVGMKTSRETLREGLAQRVFPFGDCILMEKSPVCYIYRPLLERWIAERFTSAGKGESG